MTRSHFSSSHLIRQCAFVLLALVAIGPAVAVAQQQQPAPQAARGEPGRPHSFEVALGGELLTPQSLGSATASMTSNNTTGSPFTYFSVSGTRTLAPAFRARLGYNLTPMITIEGGFVAARSNVQGTLTGDAEGATAPAMTETMTQYFVDVSLLAHLRTIAFSGGAGVPFVEAGGGYLRQMHEGNTAIDTGQIYHFGGGVTYMFPPRTGGRLTGLGVRADARIYVPRKGYSFSTTQQVFAAVGGALVLAF